MPRKRKENNQLTISVEEFDSLLWPAYRYCIGRHSYANSYIRDYWSIIKRNRDKFRQDRLRFIACDVRVYINESMRWYDNIEIDARFTGHIDAHSAIVYFLAVNPKVDPKRTTFHIDEDGKVTISPYEPPEPRYDNLGNRLMSPSVYNPIDHYFSVKDYILFANSLDSQYDCVCEGKGLREERVVVACPIVEQHSGFVRYDSEWACVDDWDLRPIKEMIKSVKKREL